MNRSILFALAFLAQRTLSACPICIDPIFSITLPDNKVYMSGSSTYWFCSELVTISNRFKPNQCAIAQSYALKDCGCQDAYRSPPPPPPINLLNMCNMCGGPNGSDLWEPGDTEWNSNVGSGSLGITSTCGSFYQTGLQGAFGGQDSSNCRTLQESTRAICYCTGPSVDELAPPPEPVPALPPTLVPVTPTLAPMNPTLPPINPTLPPVNPTLPPVTPTLPPTSNPTTAPITPATLSQTPNPTTAPVTPATPPPTFYPISSLDSSPISAPVTLTTSPTTLPPTSSAPEKSVTPATTSPPTLTPTSSTAPEKSVAAGSFQEEAKWSSLAFAGWAPWIVGAISIIFWALLVFKSRKNNDSSCDPHSIIVTPTQHCGATSWTNLNDSIEVENLNDSIEVVEP